MVCAIIIVYNQQGAVHTHTLYNIFGVDFCKSRFICLHFFNNNERRFERMFKAFLALFFIYLSISDLQYVKYETF